MAVMGRPRSYSTERAERLLDAVRRGATFRVACAVAEVSESTLGRWRRTLDGFDGKVRQAEADAALRFVGLINEAAERGQWRAAAWLLARRHPDDYGPPRLVDATSRLRQAAIEAGIDPDDAVRYALALLEGDSASPALPATQACGALDGRVAGGLPVASHRYHPDERSETEQIDQTLASLTS